MNNQKPRFSQEKFLKLTAICFTTFTLTSTFMVKSAIASTIKGGLTYSKDGTNFISNNWTGEYTFKVEFIEGPPQQIKITQESSKAKKGSGSNGWLAFIDVTTDADGNITFDQSNVPHYKSENDFKKGKVRNRGRFMGSFDSDPKDLDFKYFPKKTNFPKSFWMFTSPVPDDPEEPEFEMFQDFSSEAPFVRTNEPTSYMGFLALSIIGVSSIIKRKLK